MRNTTHLLVMLILAVGLSMMAGMAWAGSHTVEYYGCLNKGGALTGVTADGSVPVCGPGQTLIHWNEEGPQGLQGPAGPEGPAGLTDLYFREEIASVAGGAAFSVDQFCDPGDLPIAGGYHFYDGVPLPLDPGSVYVFEDRAVKVSSTVMGWRVSGRSTTGETRSLLLRVICAEISTALPEFGA